MHILISRSWEPSRGGQLFPHLYGILPLGAAGFLGWITEYSIQIEPWTQRWSLIGVVGAGIAAMLAARFLLNSPFFHIARESYSVSTHSHRR